METLGKDISDWISNARWPQDVQGAFTDDYLIYARALVGLEAYCRERKFSLRPLLRRYGLANVPSFPGLGTYIKLEDFARLLEACARRTDDDCFALRWTTTMDRTDERPRECRGSYDTVCMAAAYAPDLKEALLIMAQQGPVTFDMSSLELIADKAFMTLQWAFPPSVAHFGQLVDRVAFEYRRHISVLTGMQKAIATVELTREKPRDAQLHRDYFGVPVHFGAPVNRIRIHAEALELPNPKRNDDLFSALSELNRRRLAERRREYSIIARTGEAIVARLPDQDLSLARIALDLALSGRGLQRRLAEQGTSFQELYENTRRKVADELLSETDLPVSDIAYRLGFSAVGNFTRAARRWFDHSPSDWRRLRRRENDGGPEE